MQQRLYCEIVKIETPEASVSGVFNLRALFSEGACRSGCGLSVRLLFLVCCLVRRGGLKR